MRKISSTPRNRATRCGLSITEVIASTMLVSLVLIGALNCVAGITRGRMSTADGVKAGHLAAQLTAEILNQSYSDPNETSVFGVEGTENASSRATFDDVDDYHGWTASPPRDDKNAEMSGLQGWQREVTITWVTAAAPATTAGTDQGLKKITVTVRKDGTILAQQVSIRSDKY